MRRPLNHPPPVQRDAMRKLATTRPTPVKEEVPVVRWNDKTGRFHLAPLKSAMTVGPVWRIWNWLLRRTR